MDESAAILKNADARRLRRVLIVTALPLERDAVREHFTEIGTCVGDDQLFYDCYEYRCGGKCDDESAQGWLVVVAECGAGTHVAQSAVIYATQMFKPFELILFIGVAASRKKDIPIGSVIASDRIYYPHVGKYEGGSFHNRARLHNVGKDLKMLATWVIREDGWQDRILPTKGWQRPSDPKYDFLFTPIAKLASIVTVEAVSADVTSELEKNIESHYQDAHALEMEGFGAALAAETTGTPIMVIRGISDMRQDKNPEDDAIYQPVAAMHAAAFGVRLLDEWSSRQKPSSAALKPLGDTLALPAPAVTAAVGRAVFNLDAELENLSEEAIERILETLRQKTGNPNLKLVGLEKGSVRLIVEGGDDPAQFDQTLLREALANEHQLALKGTVSEADYRAIQALESRLPALSAGLLNWPRTLPDGEWIARPESAELVDRLRTSEQSTTVLLGVPGGGKSAILADVALQLGALGWPVLAIKADLLPATLASDADLGQALGLDQAVSAAIHKIAALRPVVLVIDQLDALAGYVDLRTDRLNVLMNLVRKLSGFRNVHIVLSSREFEFRHDVRLRTIQAEELVLAPPLWEDISAILASHGVLSDGWPADARDVMLKPQALATFLRLLPTSGAAPFATYQAMLDAMWRAQVVAHPRGSQLDGLLAEIANIMADEEVLWLAQVRFDDRHEDIETLKALGILTAHGPGTIGFAHQTLFEHALARAFARGAVALSQFVLQRSGSLFLRPKLWAALSYLRGVELQAYRREIEAIWNQPTLRSHLRQLLVEFLGQQNEPLDFEELILVQALDQQRTRTAALRSIAGSPGWFKRLGKSVIAPMMTRSDEAGLAQYILSQGARFATDAVVDMIEARWLPDPAFDNGAMQVLVECPVWDDRIAQMVVVMARRTGMAPFFLDNIVATVGADQPAYALALVEAVLDRSLEAAVAESNRRRALTAPKDEMSEAAIVWRVHNSPSDPLRRLVEDEREWDSLEALAELHPRLVVDTLWPWLKRVMAALAEVDSSQRWSPGFPLNYGLDFRFTDENSFGLPEPTLLSGLRVALETLADRDPDAVRAWIAKDEGLQAAPAQRLFAHVLASQAERFADTAFSFLMADANRLHIGNFEDQSRTAKRLITAASPYWSDEQLRAFEQHVLDHGPDYAGKGTPPVESRRAVLSILRQAKLGLLRALPEDRLSDTAQRFIQEQARVFADRLVGATYSGVQMIGSPISSESLAQASQADIVRAFEEMPDATGWNHPNRRMEGGNIQLAREFASFAREAPERAAAVLRDLTAETGTRAAGYAIAAMAESADAVLVCDLLRDTVARGFDSEEFRGSCAGAVARLVSRNFLIPSDVVAILEHWLALPVSDEPHSEDTDDQPASDPHAAAEAETEHDRSLLWDSYGMVMLPHGNYPILDALMDVYLKRGDPEGLITLFERHLERQETTEIWQALVYHMLQIHPEDPRRLAEFIRVLFARHPALIGSREAAFLLGHLHWSHPALVADLILPTKASGSARIQRYFGELVGLIALVQPDQEWATNEFQALLEANAPLHAVHGAIESAVNVWREEKAQDPATAWLVAAMPMMDARGWEIFFDLFRQLDELHPGPQTTALLSAMADHLPATVEADPMFVVSGLSSLLPHNATLVGRIANHLVEAQRARLADLRTGHSAVVPDLVDLAITLHRAGEASRETGTALFEQLMDLDLYLARQTFDEIDNRFRKTAQPRRRRLLRRSQRRQARRSFARSSSV